MRVALLFLLVTVLPGCAATPPTDAEIDSLSRAANHAYKTGICNIHHIQMRRERVPLEYAHLPIDYFSSDYEYAQLRQFPHSREYALTLDPKDPRKTVKRYVCPQCQEAERQWLSDHPRDEWGKAMGPKKI